MFRRSFALLAFVSVVIAGCREKQFVAPSVGAYGTASNAPALPVSAPRPVSAPPWTNSSLAVIESELTPAVLCFSRARTISWFSGMTNSEPGGPTFVAISTEQGPKIFKPGERIDPSRMRESWFVVWFAGARGWTNWDSPWFLTLQHRPQVIRFDTNGLHFTFGGEAGYAGLMPLYGAFKPLQASQQSSPFATLKEKKKRVLTWEWHMALPADPLARARYWASVLREFPVSCDESFSIDAAHDSVTVEHTFHWISWNDDWNTKHLKLAPVSPVLAHAFKEGFPAGFSGKPFDMEIFTDHGPYYGIEETDSWRVTLPVLGYLHATAGAGDTVPPGLDAPCFAAWQQAHRSGEWESLRSRWPALRDEFKRGGATSWPAFASAHGKSPLEQTANALGAARIAYRLQDMDTYAVAAHLFARALVQLAAQQRGMVYFRENQPWRSMEPLPSDVSLASIASNGWRTASAPSTNAPAGNPDLMRLVRAAGPAVTGQRPSSAPALERLVPGRPATPFFAHDAVTPIARGLDVAVTISESPTTIPSTNWPRLDWPDWRTSSGEPWSFGHVALPKSEPLQAQTVPVGNNARVFLLAP